MVNWVNPIEKTEGYNAAISALSDFLSIFQVRVRQLEGEYDNVGKAIEAEVSVNKLKEVVPSG